MNRKPLKGVCCLVPTVFDEKGDIDYEGFKENVRYLEREGMHGVVAMASVGQYYLTSHEEFEKLASAAKEACGEMICVIGTHFHDMAEAIARAKYAEAIGADGAFIIPQYYSNFIDAESCYAFYKAIHDATSEISIMVYNYEESGFVIDINLWERLLESFPRITAVKECTPLIEAGELVRRYGDRLCIMSGAETSYYPYKIMGGTGTVAVLATAYPRFVLALYNACEEKRWDEALKYHYLMNEHFYECFMAGGYHFDNKGIVTAAGLKGGYQRPPFKTPEVEAHKAWLQKFDEAIAK